MDSNVEGATEASYFSLHCLVLVKLEEALLTHSMGERNRTRGITRPGEGWDSNVALLLSLSSGGQTQQGLRTWTSKQASGPPLCTSKQIFPVEL